MNKLKWTGTVLCLIGMCLSAYKLFPYNIYFSCIGSALWYIVGVVKKDRPMAVVEGAAVLIMLSGIITHLIGIN